MGADYNHQILIVERCNGRREETNVPSMVK